MICRRGLRTSTEFLGEQVKEIVQESPPGRAGCAEQAIRLAHLSARTWPASPLVAGSLRWQKPSARAHKNVRARRTESHQVRHQFLSVTGCAAISNTAGNALASREASRTRKSRPTQKSGRRKIGSIRPSVSRSFFNASRTFACCLIFQVWSLSAPACDLLAENVSAEK